MVSLKPESIPLNVKVLLIGDSEIYHTLLALDPDFRKLFKVKAEFEKIGIPMPRYEQPAGIPHYYSEFINGCQYSISASGYPDYSIAIGIEFHK